MQILYVVSANSVSGASVTFKAWWGHQYKVGIICYPPPRDWNRVKVASKTQWGPVNMPTGAPVSKNPTTTSPLMRIVLHSSKRARNMWLVTKRRRGGGCRTAGFRVTGTTYFVTHLDKIKKNAKNCQKIWEIDRSYSCLQQFDKF